MARYLSETSGIVVAITIGCQDVSEDRTGLGIMDVREDDGHGLYDGGVELVSDGERVHGLKYAVRVSFIDGFVVNITFPGMFTEPASPIDPDWFAV